MCLKFLLSQCTHLCPILSVAALEQEEPLAQHTETVSIAAPQVPPGPEKNENCHTLHSCVRN
jgi:hypothetical protein